MSEAFIISAVRSAIGIGKEKGSLFPITPVELTSLILSEVVNRADVDPALIQDVIWGCVTPVGDQGANLARLGVLKAGFPFSVPAVTLNRMCGSSQQSIHFAAQAVLSGDMDFVIAGGTEMMSHQPLGTDYPSLWPDPFPYELVHQGISAELMAEKWRLSREELDGYAHQSHLKAMAAIQEGHFSSQIMPITLPNGQQFMIDEGVRMPPDRTKLSALKPVFKADGVITAGNASQVSDGSAAVLVASERAVKQYSLKPLARIVARFVTGSDPVLMLDGPITATRQVLQKSGIQLDKIDLIEINEAFASVVLAWGKELHPDFSRVNVAGGAIAHGHPLGATGAVLMTKLLYNLARLNGKFGLQTMCIGHGMATATIIERV